MEQKINIANLLKDCPKGTKLYSPLCGECYFDRLNMGTIICTKQNTQEITFTSGGYYMLPVFDDCECQLFPSKDNRDWSTFKRPFEDGDILTYTGHYTTTFIYRHKEKEPNYSTSFYVACNDAPSHNFLIYNKDALIALNENCDVRLATEEEKQKLFDTIKLHGYVWNAENKTLEKLVEPKFKVGDRIKYISGETIHRIVQITEDSYILNNLRSIPISIEHMYNLVPNKFDITTLKPFDKVLVRGGDGQKWTHDFFGFLDKDKGLPFVCVGYYVIQCIPYKGNEYLLGTDNDCGEYFKTW